MRSNISKAVAGLTLAAGTFALATALHADPAVVPASECTVSTEQSILVRAGDQELTVTLSEALGDSLTAQFAEESKITVKSVGAADESQAVKLVVDASNAVPGDWALTVRRNATACAGTVKVAVGGGDQDQR